MLRHLLASPKYGLLHTPDMPTRCEEHLRRTLGTLSVALAYWSLLFIRYLPTYSEHKPNEKEISHGIGVVANTLNGARGKRCDTDEQAEGRMSGSE
jgi:hypothetical protein